MKLELILFRLNVLSVVIVAILLAPSSQIIASWYPASHKEILWWIPVGTVGTCSVLWLIYKLSLPSLIHRGLFPDRRQQSRQEEYKRAYRIFRLIWPVLLLIIQTGMILLMAMSLFGFMDGHWLEGIFKNIP